MEKKIMIAISGVISLIVVYYISTAFQDVINQQILEAISENEPVNIMLKALGVIVDLMSTGVSEVVIGIVMLCYIFIKDTIE